MAWPSLLGVPWWLEQWFYRRFRLHSVPPSRDVAVVATSEAAVTMAEGVFFVPICRWSVKALVHHRRKKTASAPSVASVALEGKRSSTLGVPFAWLVVD